jgi:hypothetical protein
MFESESKLIARNDRVMQSTLVSRASFRDRTRWNQIAKLPQNARPVSPDCWHMAAATRPDRSVTPFERCRAVDRAIPGNNRSGRVWEKSSNVGNIHEQ